MLLDHEGRLVGNVALFTVGTWQRHLSSTGGISRILSGHLPQVDSHPCWTKCLQPTHNLTVAWSRSRIRPKTCLPCLSVMDYLASNNFLKTLTTCWESFHSMLFLSLLFFVCFPVCLNAFQSIVCQNQSQWRMGRRQNALLIVGKRGQWWWSWWRLWAWITMMMIPIMILYDDAGDDRG